VTRLTTYRDGQLKPRDWQMWNACAKPGLCRPHVQQSTCNQPIKRFEKMSHQIHRLHRKAALTTIA